MAVYTWFYMTTSMELSKLIREFELGKPPLSGSCGLRFYRIYFIFLLSVTGTAYGQGVYFAVNAQYSAGYTQPDMNGHCQMYYARVLTGEPAQGHQSMKTPPSKNDPSNPSLHYDSTIDRSNPPNMYVIYYDTQAYPEYIVTFI